VARDIDNADPPSAGEVEVREPEIDGHPATFLFLQPIGISPGQRFNQRALPVIDVSRRSGDKVPHGAHSPSEAVGGELVNINSCCSAMQNDVDLLHLVGERCRGCELRDRRVLKGVQHQRLIVGEERPNVQQERIIAHPTKDGRLVRPERGI